MTPTLPAFQCLSDYNGDIYMVPGYAWQPSTDTLLELDDQGNTVDYTTGVFAGASGPMLTARPSPTMVFCGGSGRNLELVSTATAVTVPRLLAQDVEDKWLFGSKWHIEKTGASTADLVFTTGVPAVVAQLTSGSSPVGTYNSTTTGTSINGGVAFTVTVDEQLGAFAPQASGDLTVDAGTFPEGSFVASGLWTYDHTTDALATITVDSDGSAVLYYDGVAVATRADGNPLTPGGVYVANATGEDDFNSGDPWTATIEAFPAPPAVGYVYVKLTLSSGTISSLTGPFYAATIPAQAGNDYYIPVASISALGVVTQLHTGMILWP